MERAPILEHPGSGRGLIEPAELFAKRPRLPARSVLCFFSDVLERRAAEGALAPIGALRGEGAPMAIYRAENGVAVIFPGIGGPRAACTLEELVAQGVRGAVVCGGAGVLDGGIAPGTLILPTGALRDEGTSYHYLEASRTVAPHPAAVLAIEAAAQARGLLLLRGLIWTTDAPYRETPEKIACRRAEGCLAVEMEAAALFAVAKFRGVSLAVVLYAGDDVSGPTWRSRRWMDLHETRARLFDLALEAAEGLPDG